MWTDMKRRIGHAWCGLVTLGRGDGSFRLHLVCLVLVIGCGIWLRVGATGWVLLALASGLVLAAEAFNSALEELADALHPGRHPGIGRAKDLAAAAVLLAALAAAVVALVVFVPPFWELLVGMSPRHG
jgi:diacylglycerol kinase